MRFGLKPEGPLEHLGMLLNAGPFPVAEALFGMASARVLMAAVSLGIVAELASGPVSTAAIAERCGLDAEGVHYLVDSLASMGHARREGEGYSLTPRSRRWLDPKSPKYIGESILF